MKIGIDIGGTNTDAVLINEKKEIIAAIKVQTSMPVEISFKEALAAVITPEVKQIIVGTTHATNALLQRKDLYKVGLIRIAGHKPETLPACFSMSEELKNVIFIDAITINGGYECDGREITKFSIEEAKASIKELIRKGAEAIAVVGVLSPLYNDQEQMVGSLIKEIAGEDFPFTLSYQISGIGIIERENASIINSALIKSLTNGFSQLEYIVENLSNNAQLYISKNNGTLMSLEDALSFPVLTIAAGPTNSFIGAVKLAGLDDAIVIDIGGTSSDCGIVLNGFPRRSLNNCKIAEVELNFPMPDVISIALGGGSIIDLHEEGDSGIGPESVARELQQKAQSFGGEILTLTDISAACGKIRFNDQKSLSISKEAADKILAFALSKLNNIAETMKASCKKDLPILFVGGGSRLFDSEQSNIAFDLSTNENNFTLNKQAETRENRRASLKSSPEDTASIFEFEYDFKNEARGAYYDVREQTETQENRKASLKSSPEDTASIFEFEYDFKSEARGAYYDVREQAETRENRRANLKRGVVYANAYGAALSQVSVSYDKIISLERREEVIANIEKELRELLITKGGDLASSRVIEQIIIPFHYMKGNLARVMITIASESCIIVS